MFEFDYLGALEVGSQDEIARFLSGKLGFDYDTATADGATSAEIIDYFFDSRRVKMPDRGPGPEPEKKYNFLGGVKDVGKLLYDVPINTKASIAALLEDKNPEQEYDWKDKAIEAQEERNLERSSEPGGDEYVVPGIKRQAIRDAGASTGFSLTAMGAGLPGILASSYATPIAGVPLALAGSGKAAYNMDRTMFTRQLIGAYRQNVNPDATPEEIDAFVEQSQPLINKHGLWEAIPESIGNVAQMTGIGAIFKAALGKTIGTKIFGAIAGMYGTELGTETITQTGQHNTEIEAGLSDGDKRSFTSPGDMLESFKEVAPQTVVLTSLGAGGGAVAGTATGILKAKTADDAIDEANKQIDGILGKVSTPGYTMPGELPLDLDVGDTPSDPFQNAAELTEDLPPMTESEYVGGLISDMKKEQGILGPPIEVPETTTTEDEWNAHYGQPTKIELIDKWQARKVDVPETNQDEYKKQQQKIDQESALFSQKLDTMQNEVNTTETKGVTQEHGEQYETIPYGANSPKWMQDLPTYLDKNGKKRVYSRVQLNAVFNNIKSGKKLNPNQEDLYRHIEKAANENAGETGEFVAQEEADDLEKKGFDLLGSQKIPAGDLDIGDKIIATVDGVKDEFTVQEADTPFGDVVLKDGVTKTVDVFEQIDVEAIKKGPEPGILSQTVEGAKQPDTETLPDSAVDGTQESLNIEDNPTQEDIEDIQDAQKAQEEFEASGEETVSLEDVKAELEEIPQEQVVEKGEVEIDGKQYRRVSGENSYNGVKVGNWEFKYKDQWHPVKNIQIRQNADKVLLENQDSVIPETVTDKKGKGDISTEQTTGEPKIYHDPQSGKLVHVQKGWQKDGGYTFFKTDDLKKRGRNIRGKTDQRYWYDTKEEAETALADYAQKNGFTEATEEQKSESTPKKEYNYPNPKTKIPIHLKWLAKSAWEHESAEGFEENLLRLMPESGAVTVDQSIRQMEEAGFKSPSDFWEESISLKGKIQKTLDKRDSKKRTIKKSPKKTEKFSSDYGSNNKVFTKEAADKAREILRQKLSGNQLNSGLDPEIVQAGIQIAGYHIESGARSFTAYSKAMIKDIGDVVKPYLRSWYEAARYYPGFDASGMTDGKDIKEVDTASDKTDDKTDDGDVKILSDFGLFVEQDGLTWGVSQKKKWYDKGSGKGTFENKDLLKGVGARWKQKQWRFDHDPTKNIAKALRDKHGILQPDSEKTPGDRGTSDENLDGRSPGVAGSVRKKGTHKMGTLDDPERYVQTDTIAAINKGKEFGIPQKVLNEQVDDIARIVKAHNEKTGIFLLANEAGTGKSFVLGGAMQELQRNGAKKILYVTMNNGLVNQLKKDLSAFDIKNVEFITYAKLRKTTPASYDALIFDESQNIKNVKSAVGKRANLFIEQSKFSIFASATPFENPVEAAYLEPTNIFFSGHWDWAIDHGAYTSQFRNNKFLVWPGQGSEQNAIDARNWLIDKGVMTQRDMQLDPKTSEVKVSKVSVDADYVSMYTSITNAFDYAMDNLPGKQKGQLAAYGVNLRKRILEASKLDQAIAAAKSAIKEGRNPIIFVETKAERRIDTDSIITAYDMWEQTPRDLRDKKPPYSKVTYNAAKAIQDAGFDVLTLEPTQSKIVEAFGEENVAIYTGAVSDIKAHKNLSQWRKGNKKVLVATMAKGGTGLSLHDTVGDHPTTQINLNLPWKASGVAQVSGRSARYGVVGKPKTVWIYAKNIEFDNDLASRVTQRMKDMGATVKGDIPGLAKEFEDASGDGRGEKTTIREAIGKTNTKVTSEDGRAYILEDLVTGIYKAGMSLKDFSGKVAGKLGSAYKKVKDAVVKMYHAINAHLDTFTSGSSVGALTLYRKDGTRPQYQTLNQSPENHSPWYSKMRETLSKKLNNAPAKMMKSQVNSWAKKGMFKKEELEWSGLNEWLDSKKGKVTKQEALDYLDQNQVQVEEVVKGENLSERSLAHEEISLYVNDELGDGLYFDDRGPEGYSYIIEEDKDGNLGEVVHEGYADEIAESLNLEIRTPEEQTKFSDYQLPGGKKYKEILLTLPSKSGLKKLTGFNSISEASKRAEKLKQDYKSPHWDEPNVLAHVRMSEREIDGKKVLHVEEIQSDWHQRGREKGYASGPLAELPKDTRVYSKNMAINAKTIRNNFKKHYDTVIDGLSKVYDGLSESEQKKIEKLDDAVQDYFDKDPNTENVGDPILFVEWANKVKPGTFSDEFINPVRKTKKWFVKGPGKYSRGSRSLIDSAGDVIIGRGRSENEAVKDALKNVNDYNISQSTPNAPFKKTWPMLAFKRMVRYAAENGFDTIAWTQGTEQADRYDLSKHIEEILYFTPGPGKVRMDIQTIDGERINSFDELMTFEEAEDVVGKEIVQKMQNSEGDKKRHGERSLSGIDLKVGGEGMLAFYDKILPAEVNKFFNKKAWGKSRVGEIDVFTNEAYEDSDYAELDDLTRKIAKEKGELETLHALEITKEMKSKSLKEGMPLFQGKSIDKTGENAKLSGKEKLKALFQSKKDKKDALRKSKRDKVLSKTGSITRQRLYAAIENIGDASKAKITIPANRKQKTLNKLGKALGLKTVFFKTSDPDTNITGFTYPGTDQLFINLSSGVPEIGILGHEVTHQIKNNHPDLYDYLVSEFENNKKDYFLYAATEQTNRELANLPKLSEADLLEEFIGDFAGDSFQRPEFWSKLNQKSPSMSQKLFSAIKKVVAKIKSFITRAEQYVVDIDKAQGAIAHAMSEAINRGNGLKTKPNSGSKFSVTDKKGKGNISTESNPVTPAGGVKFKKIKDIPIEDGQIHIRFSDRISDDLERGWSGFMGERADNSPEGAVQQDFGQSLKFEEIHEDLYHFFGEGGEKLGEVRKDPHTKEWVHVDHDGVAGFDLDAGKYGSTLSDIITNLEKDSYASWSFGSSSDSGKIWKEDNPITLYSGSIGDNKDINIILTGASKKTRDKFLSPKPSSTPGAGVQSSTSSFQTVKNTATKAFKKWSKGLKDNGKYKTGEPVLLKASHGSFSAGGLNKFSAEMTGSGIYGSAENNRIGHYFTTDRYIASEYATGYDVENLNQEDEYDEFLHDSILDGEIVEGAGIIDAHIRLDNPYVISGKKFSKFVEGKTKDVDSLISVLDNGGHDGVIVVWSDKSPSAKILYKEAYDKNIKVMQKAYEKASIKQQKHLEMVDHIFHQWMEKERADELPDVVRENFKIINKNDIFKGLSVDESAKEYLSGEDKWIIVRPDAANNAQIKSIHNKGTWDKNNPDIRYQTSEDLGHDGFSIEDNSSFVEDFKHNIVDELSPVSKLYKAIKKDIPEAADFRLKEQLRVSKAKGDIDKAEEKYFKPIKQLIGLGKLTVELVDEFLYARHAPEANARLRLTNARHYLRKLADAQRGDSLKNKIAEMDADFELMQFPTNEIQESYLDLLESELGTIEETFAAANQKLMRAESKLDSPLSESQIEKAEKSIAYHKKIVDKIDREFDVRDKWETFSAKPSGMTDGHIDPRDNEAKEISDKWKDNKTMAKIAKLYDAMNAEGLEISHDAGRLSDEEYNAIKGTFDYYAPLFREGYEKKRAFKGIGGGVTNLGSDVNPRGGSTKRAVHLLANGFVNHEKKIINAKKAEVASAFIKFIKMNPNKDFLSFEEPKTVATYDGSGNIERRPAFFIGKDEPKIKVKTDGKVYIVSASPNNIHAMRILDIIQGNDHNSGPIVNALGKLNRRLAAVNTTWNPEFIFSNLARDLQTAAFNLTDTEVSNMRKTIFKNVPKAMKGLYSSMQGDGSHEWVSIVKRYESSGAKIGWIDYGKDIETKAAKLESQIDLFREGHKTKKAAAKLVELVEDYNSIVENAVRLSTFKAGIDSGMSEAKAAIMAKGLTVNFNQKGAYGPVINSLYLFANAGIQGSTRIFKTIKNNPKKMAKILGGTMGLATILAIANRSLGGDDEDDIPYYDQVDDYLKARNMIFMIPGTKGKYAKIPLPWGYNVFWALGTEIGDLAIKDDYSPLDGASRMLATALDAFNPLQSATVLQTLSPTVGDPFVQVGENKTFFGSPLMPEGNPFSRTPEPDSEKYWGSVRPTSKMLAKAANTISGGNKVKPGMVDVSPETLDLVWDTFTGGAGRFLSDTVSLPIRALSGDLKTSKIPGLRRVLGSQSEYKVTTDYRSNITYIYRLHEQAKEYPAKKKKLRKNKVYTLYTSAKKYESRIKKLNTLLKRAKTEKGKEKIKKRIEKLKRAFNKKVILRRAS